MFDELNKYKEHDHFFLSFQDSLREVCNAPTNKGGVYIVYALKNGKIELIYIGCSGKHQVDGSMFIRKPESAVLKTELLMAINLERFQDENPG